MTQTTFQDYRSDFSFLVIFLTMLVVHGFLILFVFQHIKQMEREIEKPKFIVKTIQLQKPVELKKTEEKIPEKIIPENSRQTTTKPPVSKKIQSKKEPAGEKKTEENKISTETLQKLIQAQNSLSKLSSEKPASLVISAPATLETLHIKTDKPLKESELKYIDLLATALRASVRLPMNGDVEVKLTLQRSGKVQKLEIVKAESDENKKFVQSKIPSLMFPKFDNYIKIHQNYTFQITLRGGL